MKRRDLQIFLVFVLSLICVSFAFTLAYPNNIYLPLMVDNGNNTACPTSGVTDPGYAANGVNMRQIHADQAWANCLLGSGITVAVVDTGVDLSHPDLSSNLVAGYDFIDNDNNPQDQNGHGTHVAGIVAAEINDTGVVGVAPGAHILPVRVLDANGSGSNSTVADGIMWAADRAQIISLSLGSTTADSVIQNAVNYAINTKGRLVVAAAGNDGAGKNRPSYPAAFSGVVAVAAVDSGNNHAYFSNTGSYLGLSAPGVNVYSSYMGHTWRTLSGTSMATPHVSGLGALIWASHPGYSASQVYAAMKATATDLGSAGWDSVYGYGLINANPPSGFSAQDFSASVNGAAPLGNPMTVTPQDNRQAAITPGRVLARFAAGYQPSPEDLTHILGMQVYSVKFLEKQDIYALSVAPGQEWKTVDSLRALNSVLFAQPDYVVQLSD